MLKKTLPIIIGCLIGMYALVEFYVPHYHAKELMKEILDYAAILGAAAFVLGAINVFQVSWPKIRRREEDWQYKVVMLVAAGAMLLAGVSWHAIGTKDLGGFEIMQVAEAGQPELVVKSAPDITVFLNGRLLTPEFIQELGGDANARSEGKPLVLRVPEGDYALSFAVRSGGYILPPSVNLKLKNGQRGTWHATPKMEWGKDGRVKTWLYDYIFAPCNSTMFALLAFFVVSAAFRAFRARNTEAALLLGSAVFILIGLAPFGRLISDSLPDVANWIIEIPSNSGRRAIMMGAAIGGIATGLRIILGLERSHLGEE